MTKCDRQTWTTKAQAAFDSFFKEIQDYVGAVLSSSDDFMEGLKIFQEAAWDIPKKYKGNSTQVGFIPEYLVFEAIIQTISSKGCRFKQDDRTRLSDDRKETAYFVDASLNPTRLLLQGLKIGNKERDFPKTQFQHDVTYMVREEDWRIWAIVEVKGFFDGPSLEADLNKLRQAEQSYPKNSNSLFAFVGFVPWKNLSSALKDDITEFSRVDNHFAIVPGGADNSRPNSSLREFLDKL